MPIKKGILVATGLALMLVAFCAKPDSTAEGSKGDGSMSSQSVDKSMTEIAWIKEDYKQALAKADADGKLLMIDVYTDWCGPCKMMDKDTFPQKEVVDKAANFVSLKIDAEKGQGPEVAKKFNVEGFPTILFVDGKGNLVHSIIGLHEPADFVAEMDKALDKRAG
ncbi:MAG: thioredoxin domain-containing protein [Armatimonadota bacterium]|nr:thioredoxin domain-containing protein [Armatimonadota bacterium]